jgi:acetolactate synthase-1/2/3 large subunit
VEKTEDFVPLLKKCNDTPGVHIVELPVDYSENDRILNHEIKERSQRI